MLIKLLKLVGKLIYVYTLLFSYSIYYRIEDYLVVRDRGHDDPKHNDYDPSDEMYDTDGNNIAKALGHMDSDGNYITEVEGEPWGDNFPCYGIPNSGETND